MTRSSKPVAGEGLLAGLAPEEQRQLLDDLNYLNLQEIRSFCDRHGLPYRILVEAPDRSRRTATRDTDRKPVILDRVCHYLATGDVPAATTIPAAIARPREPGRALGPTDRLYYRWYDKTDPTVIGLLQDLTDGRFRNGALARVLLMEHWTRGEAPTFAEFADAWLAATNGRRDLLSPEYAFLTDLRQGDAGADWKARRAARARRALELLDRIPRP